ncbi:MAG: mannose-1-phosphate guanylyltransferase [Planctomycetia bacterium]|nr:mannose-1-phosphate guanylyltransferase [Planctomycetia bacterium]
MYRVSVATQGLITFQKGNAKMLYAIIMAGGSGTRLWPESRKNFPKQLMTLQGERSFLQCTVDRLRPTLNPENIGVVTGKNLEKPIRAQLPELAQDAIIVEPCAKNTAGCIALAALWCLEHDPDATMALLPADHVIQPAETFQKTILAAARIVENFPEKLITLGISPTYPAESFGYIERGEYFTEIADADFSGNSENSENVAETGVSDSGILDSGISVLSVFQAMRFREKPDCQTAQTYIEAGNFYWNAGIFVWKARTILECLRAYAPGVFAPVEKMCASLGTENYASVLDTEFPKMESISIDYAVMEPAARDGRILVLPAPFSWDDVGSWRAMERLFSQDSAGNTSATCPNSPVPVLVDTENCMIRNTDPKKLVACYGVSDLAVIVTPEVVLVFDKNREESVREVTRKLKEMNYEELL